MEFRRKAKSKHQFDTPESGHFSFFRHFRNLFNALGWRFNLYLKKETNKIRQDVDTKTIIVEKREAKTKTKEEEEPDGWGVKNQNGGSTFFRLVYF